MSIELDLDWFVAYVVCNQFSVYNLLISGAFILLPFCGTSNGDGSVPWSLPWWRLYNALLQAFVGKAGHSGWPWECWSWSSPQPLLDVVSTEELGKGVVGGGGGGGCLFFSGVKRSFVCLLVCFKLSICVVIIILLFCLMAGKDDGEWNKNG